MSVQDDAQQTSQSSQPSNISVAKAYLYIVATPIGNMGDITARAIDVLKKVDIIACEDTRTSGKLLSNFSINTQTWAYHEHNSEIQTPKIIEMIQRGHSVALISDAGTPLISDPGYQLVQAAHLAGVSVVPVVGASAAIGALSVAGLPSDKFSFVGFLPAKTHGRVKQLQDYAERTETLIFYEAPHRIVASLKDMAAVFGDNRPATLCRELTKTFETVKKSTLGELVNFVESDNNQQKGEIVLVVGGNVNNSSDDLSVHDPLLQRLLEDLSVKKAAALASDITGVKKNALYQRLLELQPN
ncbi:16S rRNA (cytidine(1402)-2'-O)-methyltransferase [Psychrobacter sanguinis]|uniref:16S rRNA (cytidine(1402)-2'-O)-methyltransferase n=1 Tax=Psychrobacter sanguinis TaxID=861445 RepID=UPI00191ADBBE|nr:16S rRNA (cytidine(1402)-2'-O)-methyltransferase [Psychrobacter sanguinis]MCC3346232.1 16S rRNA (cytidine(1402)-2'-O)-methyltransferase [Psychrobacter sanguinis]